MKHLSIVRACAIVVLALLMVLASASALMRRPARAAAIRVAMQGDGPLAEGVVLDYDHGSQHKAGELIPLARIENWHVSEGAPPDICAFPHLHDVTQNGIIIVDEECDRTGPFVDQVPGACGHGKVIAYRADVSADVDGPPLAEAGKTLTYMLTLTNDGPHTADYVHVLTVKTLNGREIFEGDYEATCEGCISVTPTGPRIGPLPARSSKTAQYHLKITNPALQAGTLKMAFDAIAFVGCPANSAPNDFIDPNKSNNVADQTTVISDQPDYVIAFDSPVTANAGTKARVTVNIIRVNGHSGSVTITPPPKENGIKPKPGGPITTPENSVNFKFQIGGGVTPGVYALPFTAQDSSGKTRTAIVTLIVR